jgi:hypothetical protein
MMFVRQDPAGAHSTSGRFKGSRYQGGVGPLGCGKRCIFAARRILGALDTERADRPVDGGPATWFIIRMVILFIPRDRTRPWKASRGALRRLRRFPTPLYDAVSQGDHGMKLRGLDLNLLVADVR